MPRYFYLAKSFTGETKSGVMEASNEYQLAKILRQEGLILIRAKLEKEKKALSFSFPSFGISLTEKLFFTRNLQVMVAAGLSLTKALDGLIVQTRNRRFKEALTKIKEEIVKGQSFSEALSKYPNIFSEFFRNLIKVGEETGNLEEVLKILARQMEREYELKSKIKGAMIYPAIIILAMIGIGILMLTIVVPQLAATFQELEVELPFTTKIVIGLGTFLNKKWPWVIFLSLFLGLIFWSLQKIPFLKIFFDFLVLKIPIFSSLFKNSNSAYTVRSLASLISAGVPLPRSLEITANTLSNFYYKKALLEAVEKVKKGEKLSEALKPYSKIYSPTLLQMLQVGEETGETTEILEKLADFYENEVTNQSKNLASVIEPFLMLIVGAAVGFFAVSMIQPIYSMMGAIK